MAASHCQYLTLASYHSKLVFSSSFQISKTFWYPLYSLYVLVQFVCSLNLNNFNKPISFYVDFWSNYCFFLFENDFSEVGQSPNSVPLEAMLLQVQESFNHQRSKLFQLQQQFVNLFIKAPICSILKCEMGDVYRRFTLRSV